jgi:hypothetical protein
VENYKKRVWGDEEKENKMAERKQELRKSVKKKRGYK